MTSFLFACFAACADLLGGLIVLAPARRDHKVLSVLVAFGAGFMLAVAMLEMLPSAFAAPGGMTAVLIGYLVVHLTQHTLTPHFHFGEETHHEEMVSKGIGYMALVGLLPHSFFDGVAIGSGFLGSHALGILIFTAVALHKVPTGVSLASVMLASGSSTKRTLAGVISLGVATILGAVLTPSITLLAQYGLALSAGVTIYVAASNLIPESQREHGWKIPGGVFLGVVAFYLIRTLLPGA